MRAGPKNIPDLVMVKHDMFGKLLPIVLSLLLVACVTPPAPSITPPPQTIAPPTITPPQIVAPSVTPFVMSKWEMLPDGSLLILRHPGPHYCRAAKS